MIEIRCDKCDRIFEAPDDSQGRKVECPRCGDVNIVDITQARPHAAADADDRASVAGYPPSLGPEQDVLVIRQAMFRARPLTFLALLVVVLGGGVGALMLSSQTGSGGSAALAVASLVAAMAALVTLLIWKVLTLDSRLRITTKRTIESVGLFSKSTSEILHKHIRNFTVTQSFWQRLWNVGTVGISSAAEDQTEIVMKDVPRPKDIHKVIDLYRPL